MVHGKHLEMLGRAARLAWERSRTPIPVADKALQRVKANPGWLCSHVFPTAGGGAAQLVLGAPCAVGFALQEDGHMLVWEAEASDGGAIPLRCSGQADLKLPEGAAILCAMPLPAVNNWSVDGDQPGAGRGRRDGDVAIGGLAAGYNDGSVAIWALQFAADGQLVHTLRGKLAFPPTPEPALRAVLAISNEACARVAHVAVLSSCVVLRISESESSGVPSLENQPPLTLPHSGGGGGGAHAVGCTWLSGLPLRLLAVASSVNLCVFTQTPTATLTPGRAAWQLMLRAPSPGASPLSCLAPLPTSGSLVGVVGARLVLWPALVLHCNSAMPDDLSVARCHGAPLPLWHPEHLMAWLRDGHAARVDQVARHVCAHLEAGHAPPALSAAQLAPLTNARGPGGQVLRQGGSSAAVRASAARAGCDLASAAQSIEDVFAPKESIEDVFAPKASVEDVFAPKAGRSSEATYAAPGAVQGELDLTSGLEVIAARLRRSFGLWTVERTQELLGLDAREREALDGLLAALEVVSEHAKALDFSGSRFLLRVLARSSAASSAAREAQLSVNSTDVAWAMLSECHSTLLDISLSRCTNDGWQTLRRLGVGFWMPQGDVLRGALEVAAKIQFTKRKDAQDCALLYIALGKRGQLQALCKAVRNHKLADFLANDFTTPRWRSAAQKNAFSLLGKQQHQLAAAFFLLGEYFESAVRVCVRQLADLQLGLVLCRLFSAAAPDLMANVLTGELLAQAAEQRDVWLKCVAHLLMREPLLALGDLSECFDVPPSPQERDASVLRSGLAHSTEFEPDSIIFHRTLVGLPRWRVVGAPPLPRQVLHRCAYAFSSRGCLLLGLEVLAVADHEAAPPAQNQPMSGSSHEALLRAALIGEYLLQRAAGFVGGHEAAFARSGARAACSVRLLGAGEGGDELLLRDEARALSKQFRVLPDLLRATLAPSLANASTPSALMAASVVLGALEAERPWRGLAASVSGVLVATLWSCLPDGLPVTRHMDVVRLAVSLLTSAAMIDDKGSRGELEEAEDAASLALLAAAACVDDHETLLVLVSCLSAHASAGQRCCFSAEEGDACLQRLSSCTRRPPPEAADEPLRVGSGDGGGGDNGLAREYARTRLLLCILHVVWGTQVVGQAHGAERGCLPEPSAREESSEGAQRGCGSPAPRPLLLFAEESTDPSRRSKRRCGVHVLLARWIALAQAKSSSLAAQLAGSSFPLRLLDVLGAAPTEEAPPPLKPLHKLWSVVTEALNRLSSPFAIDPLQLPPAAFAGGAAQEMPHALQADGPFDPTGAIWPLQGEALRGNEAWARGRATSRALRLSSPISLLHRKGEFIRAVCVNALNDCQLAVSLARGVLQLELVSDVNIDAQKHLDSPGCSQRPQPALASAHNEWVAWSVGVKNAATKLAERAGAGYEQSLTVFESAGSELTTRCLCSHPKLPLYLAGGDSVVQCWQFGQTIQGRGLQDHMRAQYKLPSGGSVSSLCFSPCGEQFGSVDLGGSLCLWRFQSGVDMPLPFSRLRCHARKASGLCFVGSSVVLATVGSAGSGSGESLCLWDVLLPPAQARVASCNAHDGGGVSILYSAADSSIISGGMRGDISVFDVRQRTVRQQWTAHTLAVRSLAFGDVGRHCFSASADGDIKLWDVRDRQSAPTGQWLRAHEPHTMLHPLAGTTLGRTYGVNCMARDDSVAGESPLAGCSDTSRLLTAGADGKLNMWICSPRPDL